MRPLDEWFAGPPGAWRAYGVGAFAILLGVFLSVSHFVERGDIFVKGLGGILYWGFMPGGPLVIVGICAFRRPTELPRVLGAFVGALSAPLYIPLIGMSHPNDAGADLGRGMVGLLMPLVVPVNMLIGAALGERLGRPWWTKTDVACNPYRTPLSAFWRARVLGAGVAAVGVLILWQANQEASPDPEIALWEFVHHGVLPAIPIIVLGVCTAMLPSRLSIMCGALVGAFPALACSSLLVDPNPDNHGQSIPTLVAYSLPLTLPFTVGLGGLLGNHLHRQRAGPPPP